jgi:hypothetical protein
VCVCVCVCDRGHRQARGRDPRGRLREAGAHGPKPATPWGSRCVRGGRARERWKVEETNSHMTRSWDRAGFERSPNVHRAPRSRAQSPGELGVGGVLREGRDGKGRQPAAEGGGGVVRGRQKLDRLESLARRRVGKRGSCRPERPRSSEPSSRRDCPLGDPRARLPGGRYSGQARGAHLLRG